MFRDVYLSELETLHKLAGELAARMPHLAPMLGRDADPATARLFQRLAFAFARVQERTHDDVPEIIHAVFEDIDSSLLQPVPSAALIELVPRTKTQRRPVVLDAGTTFGVRPEKGSAGTFVATEACEVRPWTLREARIDGAERRALTLDIELSSSADLERAAGEDTIVVTLAMGIESALDLRGLLIRHTRSVRARDGEKEIELAKGVQAVAAPPLGPARAAPVSALSALRDYFACPLVFCRFGIPGAQRLVELGNGVRNFEIVLELEVDVPRQIEVDASGLRLHCVPAVSLWSVEAHLQRTASGRYVVRTSDDDQRLVDVEHVEIVDGGSFRGVERWTPASVTRSLEAGRSLLFEVHRGAGVRDDEIDLSLSFLDDDGPVVLSPDAELRARVTVTSARRAGELEAGDVSHASENSPGAMAFRNVSEVTRGCPPIFAHDRLWELFHMKKLGLPALTHQPTLARLLALVNVAAWFKWPRAKPNPDRFEPLLGIERRRVSAVADGEAWPGVEVVLNVDAGAFLCDGDAHLFGELVGSLFASALQPHEWLALRVRTSMGAPIEFPRLFGTRGGP
jgi:type VI secretion system protein ImpG